MKRILISQRVIENDSYPETRDCLDIEWSHFLSEINILCCPISSMAPVKEYFSQDVAGVVLSGGNDLNCITKSKVNKLRDETEKQVLDYCVENKIPLLGVCRGLQFIANYFGIKLYPLEGHVATKHQVEVSSESLYQKFFLELTEVNSYHNYGIKNITSDFIASVTASDGSIEAIEHKTLPILGMMWHPERNFPFSESDKSLFKLFLMLKKVIQIAKETRKKILDIYYSEKFEVDTKIDNSLVTKADRLASDFIGKELFESFGIPVITEESPVDYDQRKNWNEFWLVDPLDGTKEFIARNGEFSINISLIKKGVPVLGLIQIPVQDVSYYAEFGKGAFKETSQGISRIENLRKTKELVAISSRSNFIDKTKAFFSKEEVLDVITSGSAIKFCFLAEGKCDVYPRFVGSKEWDIAAGHCILNEANCKIIDIVTGKEPEYNKPSFENNFFIASRKDLYFS